MRYRSYCLIVFAIAAICLTGSENPETSITRNRFQDIDLKFDQQYTFLYNECRDFRKLVLPQVIVSDIEAGSACYFYLLGLPLGEANKRIKSRAIPIHGKVTMRNVLDSAGMVAWKGGQPQIKLISRNRMMQSPLPRNPDEMEEFLQLRVSPGDLIVVALFQ